MDSAPSLQEQSNSNASSALSTERVFSASPRQLFAAFEQADLLAQWWGPKGFTNTFEQFDFKPGGRWVFVIHGPNGANHPNENVFKEIQPDHKILLDHVVNPWFELTVTMTPRGDGGQTHLSWVQRFENPKVATAIRNFVADANEEVLDRLEAVLTAR